MIDRPPYFELIRERSAKRWIQLEEDPELAGPWHQLFNQVQSPRHVLSELLQNADDAGATEATASVDDGEFIFIHNGADFTEEHFASLCRFGYSNKRALQTIGFRGIGFKSTFSIGDRVEVSTPTLSVAFARDRFTEPSWIPRTRPGNNETEIRVVIKDQHRLDELEKNLRDWLENPVSLLFFRNIRKIIFDSHEVHWTQLGQGPTAETALMALNGQPQARFLVARSPGVSFPADALLEIRQERLISDDSSLEFPPCSVEIVIGAKGRLFVILPTEVETALPFASNAPFIQDPGRLKIKDPAISFTNRWLLERIGSFAASVMLEWLNRDSLSDTDRAMAYDLLPDVGLNENNLDASCARIVQKSFASTIRDGRFLLVGSGKLAPAGQAIAVPRALVDIWTPEQTSEAFDASARPTLHHNVTDENRSKLINWRVVDLIDNAQILKALNQKHLPRPRTWQKLLKLWTFLAPEMSPRYNYLRASGSFPPSACIVPVQGRDVLYAATDVVRLGERRLLQSEADWAFLSEHLLALNQNWPRFVTEARRAADTSQESIDADAAGTVFDAIGMSEASDVNKVIERVAKAFFEPDQVSLDNCVRIAHIAAKLGASASNEIRFVTQDGKLRRCDDVILFDPDGSLEALLPPGWAEAHMLHDEYSKTFTSCLREDWMRWVSSGKSGLHQFVPLKQMKRSIYGRAAVEREIERLGARRSDIVFPYRTNEFLIDDWDFDSIHWEHWTKLAADDDQVWPVIVGRVLQQTVEFWQEAKSARALQVATTRSVKLLTEATLLPAWLSKLRNIKCLPDTRGFVHKPFELFRRTPETEPLMDIEPFVRAQIDTEATRPLLGLLGVRGTPMGPVRLLDRLFALAESDQPPLNELEKWYQRLDSMVESCSTSDLEKIRQSFYERKIIWTSDRTWARASGVFLIPNELEAPGAPTIFEAVARLALWRKIGVEEQPTADLAIKWLRELPAGKALSLDDARRVRALLTRHATRIWFELGHWINLVGGWVPIGTLRFGLTMQTLIGWSHLHEWVKQGSADLRGLPEIVSESAPFSDLPRLANCIQDRLHGDSKFVRDREWKPWLVRLGVELQRIDLPDAVEKDRVRAVAARLAQTVWQSVSSIAVIPYVDGTPAGTSRHADAVWIDRCLYVEDRPAPKVALAVSQGLGSAFRQSEIVDAIKLCFDRSEEYVSAYLQENFTLVSEEAIDDNQQSFADGVVFPIVNGSVNPRRHSTEPFSDPDAEIPTRSADDQASDVVSQPKLEHEISDHDYKADLSSDHSRARANKLPLINRFASHRGFRTEGDSRFFHLDGSSISKAEGSRFWVHRNATGELVRYYWPRDHCLDLEPMQVDADVWEMLNKAPDSYSFVLSDVEGIPIEVRGSRVCALVSDGQLKVYPATYRIAYDRERA